MFPIVGIGGSAGAFEAMGALLRALPTDTGMAFVLLQHLDPRGGSRYGELLKRETSLPLEEITDGMTVEPNHVYFLPPGAHVELSGRQLVLTRGPAGEHIRMPIDRFLMSLASEDKHRSIGVVLSGTNADGTSGLRAIREAGGITFAQSERSSKYFAMPAAAIASGCVDSVLPAEQIGTRLGQIARHPWLRKTPPIEPPRADAPQSKGTSKAMTSIFGQLRQGSGVDFTLYKRSTIQRRIARRMVLSRVNTIEDYAKQLRSSPDELDALFDDLLINVTQFFRDKQVYTALQKRIFPKLVRSRRAEGGDLRIWVAGCATGEEVYSLAISALEAMRKLGIEVRLQIFGTDLSETAINIARAGSYPLSIANDVSPERLRRFFNKTDSCYQVNRSLRDLCTFARQNICQDPPFSRIDLISCRNVLIYLGQELQRRCVPIFHYALAPNGYLLLGSAETVGTFADLFSLIDKRHKIYGKKITPLRPPVDFGKPRLTLGPLPVKAQMTRREHDVGSEIQREADRLVLQRVVPSGVVIDTQLQVVQFRGSTGIYLEHASGDASLNLLQMVRPNLVVDLRAAIHKALKQNVAVRKEGIYLQHRRDTLLVDFDVLPFKVAAGGSERWLLVLFTSRPIQAADLSAPDQESRGDGKSRPGVEVRLRDELRATKESLQAIIEEQEATNEELKSANEEIESSNEELQSSNEELETAKEELQSTNEELQTLNEELNTRNTEMSQVNNDLSNLLSSINLPIIMVDNALTLRRATALGEKLFNLIPTDIGRRLTDIKSNLKINNLDKLIRHVIETLETDEREVADDRGVTYSMRIRPYRTRDNKIDGAVITLVDLDPVRRSHVTLENLAAAAQTTAEASGACVLVIDSSLQILSATSAFYKTFGMTKAELANHVIFDAKSGAWKITGLREFLEKTLGTRAARRGRSATHRFAYADRRFVLNACVIGRDHERLLVAAIQELEKT
ncbi:MAG TPA: chemotaxis protein CheB [Chthoniobacter sp.]